MKGDINSDHDNEDLKWLLENPLPDSPGLFSKSPTWFKFSAYEIREINKSLYICPCQGALYESYKPFEKFPQIMLDFMTLLIDLDKLPKTFDNVKSTEHLRGLCETRERDCANLLLGFVSKYGLFGIMYEYIESFDPCRFKGENKDDFENLIVVLNKKAYKALSNSGKILHSFTDEGIANFTPLMKYSDLCSYFLPNAKEPYPEIISKEFRAYYSEKVSDIYLRNTNLRFLTSHIKKMNEFYTVNAAPLDKSPYLGSIEWSNYLKQSFGDIGLTFGFNSESNKWDLSWNFKSLIGALSIMYLMNLTGKMGPNVHICKYSKCNKIVIDKNCCCEKHDNAYRKAKERAKKERSNATS